MGILDKLKLDWVSRNLVQPALARLGTVVTTWLVTRGAESSLSEKVAVGVISAGLILFDWIMDWAARKAAERKGAIKALNR